jgi:hypothetical protein
VAPASDGSAYQEYVLTDKGRALFPVIVGLRQWGEDHYYASAEPHSTLIDRKRGQPVRRLEVRAQDGRPIGPEDTVVQKTAAA